ncbi:MAG: hypothetical protein GX609_02005 [Actinomycetales bacterium]|jgi:hypothetical protein|nr:hypothetical protein [Actinomycetales bacterium]
MTSTGGGEGRWPFERVGAGDPTPPPVAGGVTPPGAAGVTPPATGAATPPGTAGVGAGDPPPTRRRHTAEKPRRRRPPVWLLVLLGLVVVGGAVTAVMLLTDREPPEPEPARTITLPPPTPTIDPVERAEGTAFEQALPSTVLQFALTEIVEHEPFMVAGALEAYLLTYSDGGDATLTLAAGQWRTAEEAAAQLDAVLAEVGEVPEGSLEPPEPEQPAAEPTEGATEGATTTPTAEPLPDPVQGPVEVDGAEVGRFVYVPREDGSGTLWWTNTTVFFRLDGPWAEIRDVFRAFPL